MVPSSLGLLEVIVFIVEIIIDRETRRSLVTVANSSDLYEVTGNFVIDEIISHRKS